MGPQCSVGQQESWLVSGACWPQAGVLCQSLDWPFMEVEVVVSVFESSGIEAVTWASEGCDFTRTETLLALCPSLQDSGKGGRGSSGLLVSLAGRAQASTFPQSPEHDLSTSGLSGARPSPGLAVSVVSALLSSLCLAIRSLACSRFWRQGLLPWEEHIWM